MTLLTWTGAGIGDLASTAANWLPAQVPIGGDDLDFNGGTFQQCDWDILAKMGLVQSGVFSDDIVFQLFKLNCVDFKWLGNGSWIRNGLDVQFDASYENGGAVIYTSFLEKDICTSADPVTLYNDNGNAYGELLIQKSTGILRMQSPGNFSKITLDGVNGAFAFEFLGGGLPIGGTFVSNGTALNQITVQTTLPAIKSQPDLSAAAADSTYTDFQDMGFLGVGAPVIASDGTSNDLGNNTGITFSAIVAVVADTVKIRADLLAICRTALVAATAGIADIDWASTTRPYVIAERLPGLPNRGRLPFVQIIFAGFTRDPVITGGDGGGMGVMLWTIRVFTGGPPSAAQQALSENISQVCLDQIRAPVVNPNGLMIEGNDEIAATVLRPMFHQQDTTIAMDGNYCIPAGTP